MPTDNKSRRGFFISFEGGEGAGKSAQVEILARQLKENGYEVEATREPGGTLVGTQIRDITHDPQNTDLRGITEAFLMAGDRAQHVREVIEPALQAGKVVVTDRYVDSSIAYQGYGRKLGADFIQKLNGLAIDGIMPDVTFLLSVNPEVGASRRRNSTKTDRLDLQQKTFYEDVDKGYRLLVQQNPKRFVVIDANPSINEVAQMIWQHTLESLKRHYGK